MRAALDCLLSPSGALDALRSPPRGSTQRSLGPVSENPTSQARTPEDTRGASATSCGVGDGSGTKSAVRRTRGWHFGLY